MLNKVVVTGLGMVTPVGANTMQSWDNLLSGMCGIDAITIFSTDGLPCKIAAEIKTDKDSDIFFDESLYVSPKDRRKIDRFILYGIAASDQAVKDSGWVPESDYDREMTSVIVGSGIGGLPLTEDSAIRLKEYGFKKISPFTIPGILPNLLPGHIAIRNKYFGVNMSIVTACASGSHAIGNAFDMIRYGKANVVLAGGAEAALTPLSVAGFGA
uniref:beta-ketoacyl-[acyl-carrier-protein] synthase I n=1 Tax=Biomphalaria glabrata TaxID=6526 RepID=A0A2C9L8X8_BIOGL